VILNFNQALNRRCAFTGLATCSLRPPENLLPFAPRVRERAPVWTNAP